VLTSAARRRVFGEYQSTTESRFVNEIPAELVERVEPVASPRWQGGGYELSNPYGRRYGKGRSTSDAPPAFAYENEDQSARAGVRNGMRVKHRQFGTGTVVGIEDQGDDFKVTVKFNSVGTKKLMAKYAGLEPA
jgi:DNA helicase-2/ATP-dependent DNA helicase PcrA